MSPAPPPPPDGQPYPWVVPDLFRWFGLLALSAVGLVVAWWSISSTARTSTQITWLNVGIAAVVVGGLGNMTWLLQGRRAVAIRRRRLLTTAADIARVQEPGEQQRARVHVVVPGTSRYHEADCAAVVGKPVKQLTTTGHERAGRRPCGLCIRSAE